MKLDIKAPSPGESVAQVSIARWIKSNGSAVSKNEDIAEIESEKATLTVTAPESGILEIVVKEGETIAVSAVIARIETDGASTIVEEKAIAKTITQSAVTTPEATHPEIKATPLALSMIEKNHLDAGTIISRSEKITTEDVYRVLEEKKTGKRQGKRGEISSPMTPLRKKLSERLVSVKNETAMLTTFNEADMSRIIELRKTQGDAFLKKYGIKLGFMSFFAKAVCEALKEIPNVNSQIDGDHLISFPYVDLGIAVQTEKGLMVPVIKNAQDMNIPTLEQAIFSMAEKARNKKLSLDEMQGGTFTITNGGVFGSLLSTPIINPPQAAILGMHNIVERPIAENGQVVIRPMMYIALSYDHRIIDGKDSVLFLKKIKAFIENPGTIN
ncbi:MAG: dihydrolipoyllysine-residue succinyltransferase [Bacteroidetes bacterium HGW-Bacteroidetes-21]|jgi:2-oxoglutarate dehydrogenase E2 component (dihydrolipoamide succinyltransferase)|nr:MAG: dihydrolipoyllysine-residue succinyltransferase [Bacteroidetes bacterium HGW-Bacteroidetes-21]